jgi:NAD(P)-dependent dehydrogenase (short-subunit alcohol dehydrogenase family)
MSLRNMFSLENKVIVIFGGNGYLGRQFCKVILDSGGKLYSCDTNVNETDEIKEFKKKYPQQFNLIKVDATKTKELEFLYRKIVTEEKKVDVLINATTMKSDDFYLPFEEVSLDSWNIGILGNLTIPFLTIQTFIPIMKANKRGSIINISSHYGIVGNDQRIYEGSNLHEVYIKDSPDITQIYSHGVYNAAKGGVNNFTRYLAAYYGACNIRVNTLSPGGICNENENEVFLEKYSGKVPLGRKANLDEMNGALIFLASDASSYVTGHNLVVDGGYTIW